MAKLKLLLAVVSLFCVWGISPVAHAQPSKSQEAVISELIEQAREVWNRHDAEALGKLVGDDIIYVNGETAQTQGRDAYIELHQKVFSDPSLKSSQSQVTVNSIHVFASGTGGTSMATASVRWRLANIMNADGTEAPARSGRSELILKESAPGQWKLVAQRVYRQQSDQENLIKAIFEDRQKAWNNKDVDALVKTMSADIFYEAADGETISSKSVLREKYRSLFQGPLKQTTHTENLRSVHFVQDDLALAEGTWTIRNGDSTKSGKSVVLLRKFSDGKWMIVAIQPER